MEWKGNEGERRLQRQETGAAGNVNTDLNNLDKKVAALRAILNYSNSSKGCVWLCGKGHVCVECVEIYKCNNESILWHTLI